MKQYRGKTHLIIPDSHAEPGVDNRRYTWLGKLIADIEPDVIVHIGDLFDMVSLCSYDKGQQKAEGRRYGDDIQVGKDAIDLIEKEISKLNSTRKYKLYKPRKVFCVGNHEDRINRAAQDNPEFYGHLSLDDLGMEDKGWEQVPFKTPVEIDGICYAHYFISGVMGRPIGGEHPCHSAIKKMYKSCIFGHSHVWDYCERTDVMGKRMISVNVGCYLDPDQWEEYAGEANKMWRNGITILNDVQDGVFDVEFISMGRIRTMYG